MNLMMVVCSMEHRRACEFRVSSKMTNTAGVKSGVTDITKYALLIGLNRTRADSAEVLPVGARVELSVSSQQDNSNPSRFTRDRSPSECKF